MGIFDFLFKKKETIDETKLVVTQAADPNAISEAKKLEDLKKLKELEEKISGTESEVTEKFQKNVDKEDTYRATDIKNPFEGE